MADFAVLDIEGILARLLSLDEPMLERLASFGDRFKSPGELRRRVNSSFRIAMRKGVLLSNGQSRDGGISARVYRNGVYGFAAALQDDDHAILAAIANADEARPFQ
jgi:TldD protein